MAAPAAAWFRASASLLRTRGSIPAPGRRGRSLVDACVRGTGACLSSRRPYVATRPGSTVSGGSGSGGADRLSEEFLAQQLRDYELGRRHLANMMGEDEESFTQEHIDKAIEYLFPSGLFEKKARPLMKHPEQIFPKQKVIQWGEDGRPFHYLFYTGKPNYYSLMHDLYSQLLQVEAEEDKMRSKGYTSGDAKPVALPSSRWVTQEELEQSLNEQLSDHDYARFVRLGERIASQPFPTEAAREQLLRFRVALQVQSQQQEIPERRVDQEGRVYSEALGFRKRARAKVTLWESGTGKVTVNGLGHVDYFPQLQDRMQLMFPLQFAGRLGAHDAECEVSGVGSSAQAGAVRHALALALTTFLEPHLIEGMRRAGLLTKDQRTKERKKPGQEGARRKFTWKKR